MTIRKTLMGQLAESQGYCCAVCMVEATLDQPASSIAFTLGVSKRTINLYRRGIREKTLTCPQRENQIQDQ